MEQMIKEEVEAVEKHKNNKLIESNWENLSNLEEKNTIKIWHLKKSLSLLKIVVSMYISIGQVIKTSFG